jgi:hypothetical protein
MSTDRVWIRAELERALLALSLPGADVLATLPEGCAKADELALTYNHFLDAALQNFGSEFTSAQQAALRGLEELLGEMSGTHQAALWTDEAVQTHPKWLEVRSRAREARRLLGWAARDEAS